MLRFFYLLDRKETYHFYPVVFLKEDTPLEYFIPDIPKLEIVNISLASEFKYLD